MQAKLINTRKGTNRQHHYASFKSTSQILHAVPAPHLITFTVELDTD